MKSDQDGLIRHSIFLMAVTQVANVCNLLFQMVMGRTLEPTEYGIMSALMNTMLIIATPLEALRTAASHFTAHAIKANQVGLLKGFLIDWSKKLLWIALPLAFVGLLCRWRIANFFHLSSSLPIVLTIFVAIGLAYVPLLAGVLQGMQAFLWMAFSLQGLSIVRLVSGAALVWWFAPTAISGVVAQALGVFVAVAVGYYGFFRLLKGEASVAHVGGAVEKYFLRSLCMITGFAVLMNVDITLVRHFLPEEAGRFARAATIGRSIIFLPMPIALAMFPKLIAGGLDDRHLHRMLFKSLGMVAAIIGSGVLACTLFPQLPLWILYNDRTVESKALLKWVMWAMSPLGITYLLMNFEMARHRFHMAWFMVALALAYVGSVAVWHENVYQIVAVLATVSVLSMAGMIVSLFRNVQ